MAEVTLRYIRLPLEEPNVLGIRLGDPRVFLFRYVLPGLVFLVYTGIYLLLVLPTAAQKLLQTAPEIGGLAFLLSLVSLVGIGLILRTYPFDHWFRIKGFVHRRYYLRLHQEALRLGPQLGLRGESINDNDKRGRVFWDYLVQDIINSPVLRFLESAYIWWFNFVTIICLYLLAIGLSTILDPYVAIINIESPLHIIFTVVGSVIMIIPILKRGFDTLECYVNIGIVAMETYANRSQQEKPTKGNAI